MTADAALRGAMEVVAIPLADCLERAEDIRRAGRRWHFHVLPPACGHNPAPGRYAVLIEDDTAGRAYLAVSDVFPEVDVPLVKLLHGDAVLDTGAGDRVGSDRSPLLARLADLQARRVVWHHHMCFPTCRLNPEPGRWVIVIESDEGEFSEGFADEPVAVLREVEILHFGNLDAGPA